MSAVDRNLLMSLDASSCSLIAETLAKRLQSNIDYTGTATLSAMLKAEEVAELLSVKPSTVFELSRRRGDPIPSVSIGRAKRFDRGAVAEWVARQGKR